MARQIQQRVDTAANWTAANPILLKGEMGIVEGSNIYKIGDGVSRWNDLNYTQLASELTLITLNGQGSEPPPPGAGQLLTYSREVAGRMMMKTVGPSGLDTVMQPAFFNNMIAMLLPATSTALTAIAMATTTQTGTVSHPVLTFGTTLLNGMRRALITSAATAGSLAMMRGTVLMCCRGERGKQGGFFFSTRFAVSASPSDSHLQVGLFGATSLSAATLPSAQVNWLGCGWDPTDNNLMMMSNSASGTASKIDLGPNFPSNDPNAVYELVLFAAPDADTVGYRISRLDVPHTASGFFPANNIPGNNLGLAYHAKLSNNASTGSCVYNFMRMYLETDY